MYSIDEQQHYTHYLHAPHFHSLNPLIDEHVCSIHAFPYTTLVRLHFTDLLVIEQHPSAVLTAQMAHVVARACALA